MNYQNLSPEQIRAHAVRTETASYRRHLSEEEITDLRADLSGLAIAIRREQSDLKEIAAGYQSRIKELKKDLNRKMDAVEHAYETLTGELTLVDDQDGGMMYYYNEEGVLVDSRRLRNDERQMRLYPMSNEG